MESIHSYECVDNSFYCRYIFDGDNGLECIRGLKEDEMENETERWDLVWWLALGNKVMERRAKGEGLREESVG